MLAAVDQVLVITDGIPTFSLGCDDSGRAAAPGCSHTGPVHCRFDMTEAQDFASALANAPGQIAGLPVSCS